MQKKRRITLFIDQRYYTVLGSRSTHEEGAQRRGAHEVTENAHSEDVITQGHQKALTFLKGYDTDKRSELLYEALMGKIRASDGHYTLITHSANIC